MNWIGAGVWLAIGVALGLLVKAAVKRPEADTAGDTLLLAVLAAIGAAVGGMLGVGLFHFHDPQALQPGGLGGAAVLGLATALLYRWGIRGLV